MPDRIFRHSYPTRTRPVTRYSVQYPTRPDIEKTLPAGHCIFGQDQNEGGGSITQILEYHLFIEIIIKFWIWVCWDIGHPPALPKKSQKSIDEVSPPSPIYEGCAL